MKNRPFRHWFWHQLENWLNRISMLLTLWVFIWNWKCTYALGVLLCCRIRKLLKMGAKLLLVHLVELEIWWTETIWILITWKCWSLMKLMKCFLLGFWNKSMRLLNWFHPTVRYVYSVLLFKKTSSNWPKTSWMTQLRYWLKKKTLI